MIHINNKIDCCGCNACGQICPKQCITQVMDEEGFLYPSLDTNKCIDCGLCEKVCPMANKKETPPPIEVFAAKNDDAEVRLQSSSGGIVSKIAESILTSGGTVAGAVWNRSWMVEHCMIESIEDLYKIRSSKYLQSDIKNTFNDTKVLLDTGRTVLYTGTPCQISALKLYLRKSYDNLLTVECVCQSVPSPGVWSKYLQERVHKDGKKLSDITRVSLRNKETGWKGYSCSIDYKDNSRYFKYREKDLWMLGFRDGLFTRPSCTNCPAKCSHSRADITVGDLWGVSQLAPELDDDKGLTTVIVHTESGKSFLEKLNVQHLKDFSLESVAAKNKAITTSIDVPPGRVKFWNEIKAGKSILSVLKKITRDPIRIRIRQFISDCYRIIIPRK